MANAQRSNGGIGRRSTPKAEQLSEQLRRGDDPRLTSRRRVGGLALLGAGSLGVVSAYQMGLLRHLPEPPGPFNADKVDASGEAYVVGTVPDGPIGVLSYAATAVLATMGTVDRPDARPWLPLALAAKVAADALFGLFLTAEQASKHREYCSWCLVATLTSLVSVPLVVPEARQAWRRIRSS
jgi:uncharacterized membrane protein